MTTPIQMDAITDQIPEAASNLATPPIPNTQPVQKTAEKVSFRVNFWLPSLETSKKVWNKVSDAIRDNKRLIIAAVALIAFAALTHLVGIVGALVIGTLCLIFTSRGRPHF